MDIKTLYVVDTKDTNPYKNLAIEEYLEKTCISKTSVILMIWQSEKSVIIGHSQNVITEVDVVKCREDKVNIVRRKSGGGAVYQDKGNLNFSFIWFCDKCSIENTYNVVFKALKNLGLSTEKINKNDILIHQGEGVFKVSGSAFISNSQFSLHHGTLLVDLNIKNAEKYLTPPAEKLSSKGIDSIKQRITNIKNLIPDITIRKVKNALIQAAETEFKTKAESDEFLTESKLQKLPEVMKLEKLYKSREWIYSNQTLFPFKEKHVFSWGEVEMKVFIDNNFLSNVGIVANVKDKGWISKICAFVHNKKTRPSEWQKSMSELSQKYPEYKKEFLGLGKVFLKPFIF